MADTNPTIDSLLAENERRRALIDAPFNPYTGEGSPGERVHVHIPDFPIPDQWLPVAMLDVPLVRRLVDAGSLAAFAASEFPVTAPVDSADGPSQPPIIDRAAAFQAAVAPASDLIVDAFVRIRCLHDFTFWAATYVYIKDKDPGAPDCLFRLNYPQRLYLDALEAQRLAGKPIRICMCKARQWGGSTLTQIYMAWLQLVHRPNLNSVIIAHVNSASEKIKAMFRKMLDRYPVELLHNPLDTCDPDEKKLVWDGNSDSTQRIPQRGCTISVGSSVSPDSTRSGDYALAHISEIGLFKDTAQIHPADLIRSATSGILYRPYTMIVYESTADGVGTYFHGEWIAATEGRSQFQPFFLPWYQIPQYTLPVTDESAFAARLIDRRDSTDAPSDRADSGAYLWWLWQQGATLEAINWYITERTKYADPAKMRAEFPTDAIEAFVNNGSSVFDLYRVEALRATCRAPRLTGYLSDDTPPVDPKSPKSPMMPTPAEFVSDPNGDLWIWSLPEPDPTVSHRYLTVVDIGARTAKADWSVIVVFDRIQMLSGGNPSVVAQWRGHTDIDLLAWKAAAVAAFYDNALLVIESNTIETHDAERHIEGGDQSMFILNQIRRAYPNLYARRPSEQDVRLGLPRKYGFHTNAATKPMIISNLIRVVREGLYTERDSRCLDEMLHYERKPSGAYGAITGCHDDLLMTRAIGLHICYNEMPMPVTADTAPHQPHVDRPNSLATF